MRIDVPHLRSIESAVAADMDLLAGRILAGQVPLVLHGFTVITPAGGAATALQVEVAGGVMIHPLASESGSIFFVPADRPVETLNVANTRLQGSFTAGTVNYVGVDLRRSADASTADNAQFLNPDTNLETPKEVPLGRTLDYVLVVSTQDFSGTPTIAPLAKVTTDVSNNVTAIEDARNFLFRLGSGGTVTDPLHAYPWPRGRTEAAGNADFNAADKAIQSAKDWFDATMTRLWELGGGEHWYSPTADRNVQMVRSGSTFANGEYFEWSGTHLHWKGLTFVFDNSTAFYNQVADQTADSAGLTDLADGECVYVDLDRTANRSGGTALTAAKAPYTLLGTPLVPGSRFVIAVRVGSNVYTRDQYFAVGSAFAPATDLALGVVKLTVASDSPATPVVPSVDVNYVAAVRGISRTHAGGNLGSGTLTVGGGTNDTGVAIGKTSGASRTTVDGTTATTPGVGLVGKSGLLVAQDHNDKNVTGSFLEEWWTRAVSADSLAAYMTNRGHLNLDRVVAHQTELSAVDTTGESNGFSPVFLVGTSTGVLTLTGSPRKQVQGLVVITLGGPRGTAKFRFSADGGVTYGAEVTTAATNTDAATGIVFNWTGGGANYVLNDTFSFRTVFGPQSRWSDDAGNSRYQIDHCGFPSGRRSELREEWLYDTATSVGVTAKLLPATNAGWQVTVAGGSGPAAIAAPDAIINGKKITMQTGGAGGGVTSVTDAGGVVIPGSSTVIVMEWEAYMNATHANIDVVAGLTDTASGLGAIANAIGFKSIGGGNWYAFTRSGGAGNETQVDTGVAVSGSGSTRFRCEFHGSSTPLGNGLNRAIFFVNDNFVAGISVFVPTVLLNRYFALLTNAAATGLEKFLVGPNVTQWNRVADAAGL